MTDLFIKVRTHQEQNLPFIIFSKPESSKTVGLFQKNDHLYFLENFDKKGFVFAPFDSEVMPFLPLQHCDVFVEKNNFSTYFFENIEDTNSSLGNDHFEEMVAKAVESIKNNHFEKVVVSRRELHSLKNFDIEIFYKKLLQNYPNAFNYCFYHPKVGLWIGASPEQLLKTKETNFETVALAGTQKADAVEDVIWTEKEIKEQQFVTDYILDNIKGFTKELKISSPKTVQAGSIFHIRTKISGKLKSKKAIEKVIKSLHPTSAVCGMPKQEAKEFIVSNEGYDREYYSGFLGELNIDLVTFRTQHSDLFVNLRCLKIVENVAQIFVGCGITSESKPKEEYLETVNKAMIMKKIIA